MDQDKEHPDVIALMHGEYCIDHKTLLEEGKCEDCILSKPAWKEPKKETVVTSESFNWTTGLLVVVMIIGFWGGICWYVGN